MNPERTILITGCSSGIGLASARVMKARGWRVFATARKPDDLAMLRSIGVEPVSLELSDPVSIAVCAETVIARTSGRIDALFNNAAYGQIGAVEDLTPEHLRRQFEVNVIGQHDLARRLIVPMRARGRGRIVQCSSVLGFVTGPYRGAYCASKFALEALSDCLRLELAGSGILVSIIEPGPIRSRFVDHAIHALRANIDIENSPHRETYLARLKMLEAGGRSTFKLEPEAVAAKLVHAVESPRPKTRYFVTVPTYLAAIVKRTAPTFLLDRFARKM